MTKPEDMTGEQLFDAYEDCQAAIADAVHSSRELPKSVYDKGDELRDELLRRLGAAGSASPQHRELERVAAKIASDPETRESLKASLEDSKAGRVYTTAQVKERLASKSASPQGDLLAITHEIAAEVYGPYLLTMHRDAPEHPYNKIAEILRKHFPGSVSTHGPRPNDTLYVVEHKRDGVWRLHLDMNVSTIESAAILAMQELRRQWPAAEWRVASYVPAQFFAAAPAEETKEKR